MKYVERDRVEYTLEVTVNGVSTLFKCNRDWKPIFSCPEEKALYDELMNLPHELKTTMKTYPLPLIGICECGYEEYHMMWTYLTGCPRCGRRYTISGKALA